MNDINIWKYNTYIGTAGALTTLGLGFGIPQHSGYEVHSPYLLDDSTITSLLLFGTFFSVLGSYLHKKLEESTNLTQERLNSGRASLMPFSIVAAGCLMTASLYAFDTAFFGGNVFGSHKPNAGPETVSEKSLFSALYSIVALAGLFVAYAEFRSIKKATASDRQSNNENTLLLNSSHQNNNTSSSGNIFTSMFSELKQNINSIKIHFSGHQRF